MMVKGEKRRRPAELWMDGCVHCVFVCLLRIYRCASVITTSHIEIASPWPLCISDC